MEWRSWGFFNPNSPKDSVFWHELPAMSDSIIKALLRSVNGRGKFSYCRKQYKDLHYAERKSYGIMLKDNSGNTWNLFWHELQQLSVSEMHIVGRLMMVFNDIKEPETAKVIDFPLPTATSTQADTAIAAFRQ